MEFAIQGAAFGAALGFVGASQTGWVRFIGGIAGLTAGALFIGTSPDLGVLGIRTACGVVGLGLGLTGRTKGNSPAKTSRPGSCETPKLPETVTDANAPSPSSTNEGGTTQSSYTEAVVEPKTGRAVKTLVNLTDAQRAALQRNIVIGKQQNLRTGKLRSGDQVLLTYRGMDWPTNMERLQCVMDEGRPIRDLDILDPTGALGREHTYLIQGGWQRVHFKGDDFWVRSSFFEW